MSRGRRLLCVVAWLRFGVWPRSRVVVWADMSSTGRGRRPAAAPHTHGRAAAPTGATAAAEGPSNAQGSGLQAYGLFALDGAAYRRCQPSFPRPIPCASREATGSCAPPRRRLRTWARVNAGPRMSM
jgi:hypothetical protein